MIKREQMKEIRDELVYFKSSPLYEYRVKNKYFPVVGEGSHDASIVFVGEAPGKTEALCGRPFCGRSGKFLDEMLSSIGLKREDVYITNVVKDRPPENRDPMPEEINLYSPFLDRQLEIIKPKVIVMLGRISMKYIFEKAGLASSLEPISKMHGKIYEGELSGIKIKLLPLYHPAVALYNGGMRKVLLDDFKQVKNYI